MPDFDELRQQAQDARAQAERATDALFAAKQRLRRAQGRLTDLGRVFDERNREHTAARQRLEQQRADAESLLEEQAGLHERAAGALHGAFERLAPLTDPRDGITELADSYPILLLPVRLETRFKTVTGDRGASRRELWVRVYPDDCSIDTFESMLSDVEVESARSYWIQMWAAGGIEDEHRAAWRALVASHGSGRAAWITQQYRPVNADAPPTKPRREDIMLVIATNVPLDGPSETAAAVYWRSVWLADGVQAAEEAALATLTGAVGDARAAEIVGSYRPANLARTPPAPLSRADVNVTAAFVVFPDDDDVDLKEHSWSRAPTAALLPDRFVFLGYPAATGPVVQLGNPLPATLVVGPDPSAPPDEQLRPEDGELVVPDDLRWMVDFDQAVKDGMGFRIPLDGAAEQGFERVLVVGLRLSADEAQSQADLETLLRHHRFGHSGLSLLPQGTPTNNTEGTDAQRSTDDDTDGSFEDQQPGALFGTEFDWLDKADGQWLAEYLGIDTEVLAHVHNSGGRDQADARAMNTALWPATLGYWMETMMDPVLSREIIEKTREFFTRFVSGRGAIPALRIGQQPYGIQPATAFSRMQWLRAGRDDVVIERFAAPGDDFLTRLYELLLLVDADWAGMADQVAFAGKAGDAHELLLDIVGLHSGSVEFSQRYAESLESLYNRLNLAGFGGFLAALVVGGIVQSGTDLLQRLGYSGDEPPDLLSKLFLGRHNLLAGAVVDDRPLSESEPIRAYTADGRNYIRWLIAAAGTSLDTLYAQRDFDQGPPRALLYLLLRHALQLAYHDTGLRLHESAGLLDGPALRAAKREAPFIHIADEVAHSESRYQLLYAAEPAITGSDTLLLGEFIGTSLPTLSPAQALREQVRALERLENASTARLERALAEHVDCCSYRLDAWLLGLVHYQLALMRNLLPNQDAAASRGIYVGAYAWLEDVRPRDKDMTPVELPAELDKVFDASGEPPLERDPANQGWIHAPSLNHAVAAAVLRSGYNSDATPDDPGTLAVNLTSERVRTALALLEGIRAGQGLGALLGYQFERGLHDRYQLAEVDKFIYDIRKAFPLASGRLQSTQTGDDVAVEAVEARNVVDGLRLVEHIAATGDPTYPFGKTLPVATADEQAAINAEVERLLDSHDAVADLALAEGVYQAVLGNYDRVASTYEAYSKGDFPPEPDVVRTPVSGSAVTHRVALHLEPGLDPAVSPVPGVDVTPRARVEPAVNNWLVTVLPDAGNIGCLVGFRDAASGALVEAQVTLGDLALQPVDLLVLLRDESGQAMAELDDRVVRFVLATHQPRPDTPVRIRYMETDTAPFPVFQVMPLVRSLRRLLQAARPLHASDLALTGEATESQDADLFIDAQRVVTAGDALADLRDDLADYRDELDTLLDGVAADPDTLLDDVDDHVHRLATLMARAASCAVSQAGWGFAYDFRRRVFVALMGRFADLVDRWDTRLAKFDQLLTDEAGMPVTATDAERFALLADAEQLVSTARTSPLPALPAGFRAQLLAQRGQLSDKRDAFASIAATTRDSVSDLYSDVRDALEAPPIGELEEGGFPIAEETGEAVRFVQDAVGVVAVVRGELDRRLAGAKDLLDQHDAAAAPAARVRALQAAAKALLGDDVTLLPEFELPAPVAGEITNALAASADGTLFTHLRDTVEVDLPVDTWLYGAARTRDQLHIWEQLLMLTGALGVDEPELTAIQLPFRPDDRWLALEFPADYELNSEHLCYTAHHATPFDGTARQCGLLLDEWSEVIPGPDTDTGIAFHYDRPNAEPPQAMLLVTPSQFRGRWQWIDLVDALHETLDLAKRRAVEPVHVDASPYAPFLPATVMAVTVAQLSISANLSLNNHVQAFAEEG